MRSSGVPARSDFRPFRLLGRPGTTRGVAQSIADKSDLAAPKHPEEEKRTLRFAGLFLHSSGWIRTTDLTIMSCPHLVPEPSRLFPMPLKMANLPAGPSRAFPALPGSFYLLLPTRCGELKAVLLSAGRGVKVRLPSVPLAW